MNKIDARRRAEIWRWLVDQNLPVPKDLTREELLGVFSANIFLLMEFQKTIDSLGGMYQSLSTHEWKKPLI